VCEGLVCTVQFAFTVENTEINGGLCFHK